VVPHLGSTIIPSHSTHYRLNMWSSWVRRNGTTQVMYVAKLKDGPKRVKKISQWFWKGFLKLYDGEGENKITSKRIFEVEVSFSSENVNFSFIWRDFWTFSLFSALSLEDLGVLMIFEEKITSSETSF
jgi:hypothetical protein